MNVIELITRLRYSRYEHDNGIGDEAADALEAQAREIADLSANLERLQQRWATRPVTDDLQARLAEAKGLLEEIGDEWPAVKRTTVERAYALIARPADSADAAQGS